MHIIIRAAVVAALCSAIPGSAAAQDARGLELGVHYAALRMSDADVTDSGIGGRVGWNVTNLLAIEGVADIFPAGSGDVVRGGRKFHVLAGPRLTFRGAAVGLFGRTRVGAARLGEGRAFRVCIAIFPPPESCFAAETRLAFDVGGGLEVYPSPRTSLRVDLGSLITRLGDASQRFGRRSGYASDFQFSAGAGFRF